MPQIASQNSFYFEKGCHVGQGVVSRMKHRGGARKRVVRVRLDGAAVPARGTPAMDGELPVGTLGALAGKCARDATAGPGGGGEGGGAALSAGGVGAEVEVVAK
jgi:folate-binding Fe-S cluster repair protein YgfZ